MLKTTNNSIAFVPGRFYGVSAEVGAFVYSGGLGSNCDINDPLVQFSLLDSAGGKHAVRSNLDPCTAPGAQLITPSGNKIAVARLSAQAYRWPASAPAGNGGFQIENTQNTRHGDDAAFSNVLVEDQTPQLDKAFSPSSIGVGETATLTFTITNTSELGAKNGWSFTDNFTAPLVLADTTAGGTCSSTSATGATTGASSVTLTGNIDQGVSSCTVTVHVKATRPGSVANDGSNIVADGVVPPTQGTTLVATNQPELTVEKTPDFSSANVGDTINASFVARNTGNVTPTGVSVGDTQTASSGPVTVSCPATTLAVGASMTCTGSYVVTAADFRVGGVQDTANASGTGPMGGTTNAQSSPVTVAVPDQPALSMTKTANLTHIHSVGQTITYTFVAKNTSRVPLMGVTVTDTQLAPAGPVTVTCPSTFTGALAGGASVTCTGTYIVTAADLNHGSVADTAVATGTDSNGDHVTAPKASLTIPSDLTSLTAGFQESGKPVLQTTNRQPPITGTGEPGTTVTIRDTQGNPVCTATVDSTGHYSCTPTSPLPYGSNDFTVTDSLGRTTTTHVTVYKLLTAVMTQTGTNSVTTASPRPPLSGTGTPNALMTVRDSTGRVACTAVSDASGNFSCTPTFDLTTGTTTLTVSDPFGNSGIRCR